MRGLILTLALTGCSHHWCVTTHTARPYAPLLWISRRRVPARSVTAVRVSANGQPLHPMSGSSCAAHYEWRTVIVATVIGCGARLELIAKNVSGRPVVLRVAYRYLPAHGPGGPPL